MGTIVCCLILYGEMKGKMKMKETPKIILMGDIKHLSTQTAENFSYRIVMLSRKESYFGNIPL